MTVEVIGQSALGRDMYLVTINALDTKHQKQSFKNWQQFRKLAPVDPRRAQIGLSSRHDKIKVPIYVQAGIHGNESEGIDASLQIIERLATTPYGTDPEVDAILDNAVVLFNVIQNPDGHIANQRANGNNFDLNRDFLTQSQSETKASVAIMQKWLPPEVLDLHGYVTPTLIEATTKPHNPSIEYDLWLKWNQARIDANEAAMNAIGLAVTRPVNDWCPNGDLPPASTGLCARRDPARPRSRRGLGRLGPLLHPDVRAAHRPQRLDGRDVQLDRHGLRCPRLDDASAWPRRLTDGAVHRRRGRRSSTTSPTGTTYSGTRLEIYIRGEENAARPACCPPPFEVANNWMTEYPKAYVIPLGKGQRSDAEANRLVEWLLENGIEVGQKQVRLHVWRAEFDQGTYVVGMTQAHRGLADTALGIGNDISALITLYAPPGGVEPRLSVGCRHGRRSLRPTSPRRTSEIKKANRCSGGVEPGTADRVRAR